MPYLKSVYKILKNRADEFVNNHTFLTSIIATLIAAFIIYVIACIYTYVSLKWKIKLKVLNIIPSVNNIEDNFRYNVEHTFPPPNNNDVCWYVKIKISNSSDKTLIFDKSWAFSSKLKLNKSSLMGDKIKVSPGDYEEFYIPIGVKAPPGEKVALFIKSTAGHTFYCKTILKKTCHNLLSHTVCNYNKNDDNEENNLDQIAIEAMRPTIKGRINDIKHWWRIKFTYNWRYKIKFWFNKIRYEL